MVSAEQSNNKINHVIINPIFGLRVFFREIGEFYHLTTLNNLKSHKTKIESQL